MRWALLLLLLTGCGATAQAQTGECDSMTVLQVWPDVEGDWVRWTSVDASVAVEDLSLGLACDPGVGRTSTSVSLAGTITVPEGQVVVEVRVETGGHCDVRLEHEP